MLLHLKVLALPAATSEAQVIPASYMRVRYKEHRTTPMPFPAKTSGFLYYHSPLGDVSPISGEVRFRSTGSADPSGHRLALPE